MATPVLDTDLLSAPAMVSESGTAPPSSPVESDPTSTHGSEVLLALPHPLPKTPTHKTVADSQAITSTPFALKPGSIVSRKHVRNAIYPLLRHDLKNHTKTISVDKWVESILGVSADTISTWSNLFSTKKILLDPVILPNMRLYQRQKLEPECYKPWSIIANRIIKLAPEILPLPDYPLPSLFFIRHDPDQIKGPGPYHAQRSPDIVITLKEVIGELLNKTVDAIDIDKIIREDESVTEKIRWNQVISCVEFKPGKINLKKAFNEWEQAITTLGALDVQASDPSPPLSQDDLFRPTSLPTQLSRTLTGSSRSRKRKPEGTAENVPIGKRSKTGTLEVAPDILQQVGPTVGVEQAASYALEILASSHGTRSHCLQLLVDGPKLQLWYYDAGGMIRSERMCWVTDFNKFSAIIVAFACLDLAGWGIDSIPNFTPPKSRPAGIHLPESLEGYTIQMLHRTEAGEREVEVVLGQEIFTQYSLVGRRTIVYDAAITGPDIPSVLDKPLVLKMSMQASCRIPEHKLLNIARDAKVEHLPEVHMWTDMETEWRLSNGIWGKVFPDNTDGKEYEDRCQRLVIFTKYRAIEDVIVPANFHSIFAQVIQCVHDLRFEAKMLHRDISLSNLMCETRDGSIWVILNDFDLATCVDGKGHPVKGGSSKHRTGTLPFMAVDILKNLTTSVHYLRHDLESVFWVALWCLVKLPHSKDTKIEEARRQALLPFEEGTLEQIKQAKYGIINDPDDFQKLSLTPEMLDYQEWIFGFRSVICDGYRAIDNANNARLVAASRARRGKEKTQGDSWGGDPETLNKVLTCQKIIDQLKSWEEEYLEEDVIPYYSKQ